MYLLVREMFNDIFLLQMLGEFLYANEPREIQLPKEHPRNKRASRLMTHGRGPCKL